MRCATSGAEVRNKVSVHPVQSWKCSQITDGRLMLPMAAATSKTDFLLVSANPIGAVAMSMLHNWTKLLRETPAAFRCSAIVGCLDILRLPRARHYPAPVGRIYAIESELFSTVESHGNGEE